MTASKDKSDQVPSEFPQTNPPPSSAYDQMQVMQSLNEIQGDLRALRTQTDRLITDVAKSDDHIDKIRNKIGRAEGFGIAAIILFAAFGGIVWWLIGGQINNLRDQVIKFQQTEIVKPSSANTPSNSD